MRQLNCNLWKLKDEILETINYYSFIDETEETKEKIFEFYESGKFSRMYAMDAEEIKTPPAIFHQGSVIQQRMRIRPLSHKLTSIALNPNDLTLKNLILKSKSLHFDDSKKYILEIKNHKINLCLTLDGFTEIGNQNIYKFNISKENSCGLNFLKALLTTKDISENL